jgi:hypothetical protein
VINTQSVNNKKQYLFFLKKSVKEKKEKLKNNKNIDKKIMMNRPRIK